jgi:hypothetical protein
MASHLERSTLACVRSASLIRDRFIAGAERKPGEVSSRRRAQPEVHGHRYRRQLRLEIQKRSDDAATIALIEYRHPDRRMRLGAKRRFITNERTDERDEEF